VSALQEGKSGIIALDETCSEAVQAMLRYLYTSDYEDPSQESPNPLLDAQVYALADFCALPFLKTQAAEGFRKSACLFDPGFLKSVDVVYGTSSDDDVTLKTIAIAQVSTNRDVNILFVHNENGHYGEHDPLG